MCVCQMFWAKRAVQGIEIPSLIKPQNGVWVTLEDFYNYREYGIKKNQTKEMPCKYYTVFRKKQVDSNNVEIRHLLRPMTSL